MTESAANVTPTLVYNRIYGRSPLRTAVEGMGFVMRDMAQAQPGELDALLASAHLLQISSGANDMAPHEEARAPLLDRMPRLLMVSTIGAGYDPVDVQECTRRGIIAVNQGGGANAQAVIEHTLAMMMSLGRHIPQADRQMRRVSGIDRHLYVTHSIQGRTVGIIGFGHVGRGLARLCSQALQMKVLVASEHAKPADLAAAGATKVPMDEMLAQSDFVLVCCALNQRTRGLVDARAFSLMKRGAYFITTARGGIHDEAALQAALEQGHLAGAGIDVWDVEPPPLSHPLLQMDNVIASPHVAGATFESREQATELAITQIRDALRRRAPVNLLNPEAWPRFLERLDASGLALKEEGLA